MPTLLSKEAPTSNLALDLVRVTEAAALASGRWLGRGNKDEGDRAAVDAMRQMFNVLPIQGKIIIGEGAKDEAPMLSNGEEVGIGTGLGLDIAVDPVEGTSLLASGRPNAICAIGASPTGTMFNPGPSYYMRKLVVPKEAQNVVELDAPVKDTLANVAKALGKDIDDLVVFILDKPRHQKLVQSIRLAGARIQLHTDGDVCGSLMAVNPHSDVDIMMGIGGTPEGVLSACGIKGMGGQLFARLEPQSVAEKEAVQAFGINCDEILDVDSIIKGDDVFFAATGLSGGAFLREVSYSGNTAITHSLAIRSKTGSLRYMEAHHDLERLMKISSVAYD